MTNLAYARPRGREFAMNAWTPGARDHLFDAGAYGLAEFGRPVGAPVARQIVRTY